MIFPNFGADYKLKTTITIPMNAQDMLGLARKLNWKVKQLTTRQLVAYVWNGLTPHSQFSHKILAITGMAYQAVRVTYTNGGDWYETRPLSIYIVHVKWQWNVLLICKSCKTPRSKLFNLVGDNISKHRVLTLQGRWNSRTFQVFQDSKSNFQGLGPSRSTDYFRPHSQHGHT
jgi:hypothetical protein